MKIGINSFAIAAMSEGKPSPQRNAMSLQALLERMVLADTVGLDVVAIGEHHRPANLDAAPTMILATLAGLTKRVRLSSAVTVLSANDPVRVFQDFATLDLISGGRVDIVVGRGSSVDAFPLYGYDLKDYDLLFAEKLELLLKIRDNEVVNWEGEFRAPLINQAIYPRPLQNSIPIWLGVGGTPASFVRAGTLGLPLMVGIIGGETHRFRPLIDLYREAGKKAGFAPEQLKVGISGHGYLAETTEQALDEYYPGYAQVFNRIGKDRGWPPVTRSYFNEQNGPLGALMVGSPKEVADKILRHSEALGGIDEILIKMDDVELSQDKLLKAIELLGYVVAPIVKG